MAAPPWPYVVHPIDDLLEHVDQLELLIVGGGHLIRFDEGVAPGYEPTSASIPLPTGYWLTPTLAAASAGVAVGLERGRGLGGHAGLGATAPRACGRSGVLRLGP